MTVIALNYWPWHFAMNTREGNKEGIDTQEPGDEDYVHVGEESPHLSAISVTKPTGWKQGDISLSRIEDDVATYFELRKSLRLCLLLAALACILRPTNTLIWICFACFALFRTKNYGQFMEIRWAASPVWVHITSLELFPATEHERKALFMEGVICGYEYDRPPILVNATDSTLKIFCAYPFDVCGPPLLRTAYLSPSTFSLLQHCAISRCVLRQKSQGLLPYRGPSSPLDHVRSVRHTGITSGSFSPERHSDIHQQLHLHSGHKIPACYNLHCRSHNSFAHLA